MNLFFILDTAGTDNVEIAAKNGTVTLIKKVQDDEATTNTDTTDPTKTKTVDADTWIDSADYDIGDDVPFQLTGDLPANYDRFTTFAYAFHDIASAGLTVKTDTIEVYVLNGETKTKLDPSPFTVETADTADPKFFQEGESFAVGIKNLKSVNGVNKGSKIIVEYKATLNTDAVIGADGNPNEAYLQFSNNATHDGQGTVDEEENTSDTPKDKVIVFTYQTNVTKTFTGGTPTAMPEFTLYKETTANDGTTSWTEYTNAKETAAAKAVTGTTEDDVTTYSSNYVGLDAGKYKLVETKVPDGFNKAEDVVFEVTAEHSIEAADPILIDLKTGNANVTADKADGKVTGALSTAIENKAGSTLPSTGGMGTVILYTIGGLIVLAAAAGLTIAFKRRQN